MAVVLTSEESSHFSTGSLRRSQSQSHFGSVSSTFHSSGSNLAGDYAALSKSYSRSTPSSASSSPRIPHAESTDSSDTSTPASHFSLGSDDFDDTLAFDGSYQDELDLPSYKEEGLFIHPPTSSPQDTLESPLSSPKAGDLYPSSPDYVNSNDTPKPDTPEFPEHAEDDTAVSTRPSRQVDYLSHNWREEDIWSSWRYIVNRRGEFPNSERLENASWRTWMKAKNNLSTVSPETLNW